MVSTSHPLVTEAALRVLREGGNAVDALLTAMPLQHVVEPQMSTIAGGFAMLYREAKTGNAYLLNAELDHPSGGPLPPGYPLAEHGVPETSGIRIAVPGTVAGMKAAAERFGTRTWDSYFAPAIATADDGFPMYSFLYGEMAADYDRLVHFPSGRERYTPDGFLPPVGTTYRQPKLAATLRRISQPDGPDWFQRGEFARHFVSAVRETGGHISEEDLAGYEVRWDEPVRYRFGEDELLGGFPPVNGGLYTGYVLGVLERIGLDPSTPWLESPHAIATIARIMASADEHVYHYCQDPHAFDVPLDLILSDDYLRLQARLIAGSFPRADLTPPKRTHDSSRPNHQTPGSTDSNHIVIVDGEGNWLTMLHTVYGTPFGTGLVIDGVGVNSGNGFAGVSVGPGRRIMTPLTPILALRDGQPWLAIGTPGSANQTISLMLINLLHYRMGIAEAIDAPRFRLAASTGSRLGWGIGKLAHEDRFPAETLAGLARLGIETQSLGIYNWHVGSVQAIVRDIETGELTGAADPRRAGHAEGF
ncbi:MAG TPA: gamma-glutamyltransferase [Thermomicrobiaceae bacterium]|nr:gamma-glutamyltransferase [Thermomicrobiaceae bacterium]